MTTNQKVAEILSKGGSIVMHKNDLERLKETTAAGQRPDVFNGVKIYWDPYGGVVEGRPIAMIMGGDSVGFKFNGD